ncbi:MAG TPA: hypothetical protein VFW98_16225 [Gemmatimonadaceae bacterium]|nr:hypothetical protein [Gemmatimonadaceae bacterium]
MQATHQRAVVYDLERMSHFMRSVAYARATQAHMTDHWETSQNAVIRAMYALLPWKEPPGQVDVVFHWKQIQADTNRWHEHYLNTWGSKLVTDHRAARRYVAGMAEVRRYDLEAIQQKLRDAQHLNQAIRGEVNTFIRELAVTKYVATVSVAILGLLPVLGFAAGSAVLLPIVGEVASTALVGAGYGITCSLVSTWAQGEHANVVGVAIPSGGLATKEGVRRYGEATAHEQQRIIDEAGRAMEKQSKRIANALRAQQRAVRAGNHGVRRGAKVARRLAKRLHGSARSEMRSASRVLRRTRIITKGVPVVFAALSIFSAYEDLKATVQQTRYP